MGIAAILRDKGGHVATVEAADTVATVVTILMSKRIGAVLVADCGAIVGVVSERDVVRCLGEHKGAVLDLAAREIMTCPVISISPDSSVAQAMELMTDRRIRHLPVIESGALCGIVSIGDLVKRRIEEAEQEPLALKDYIATS